MTNNELYDILRPYIRPDEKILWTGRPTTSRIPGRTLFPMIFAVLVVLFFLVWFRVAMMVPGPFFLFGLFFMFFFGFAIYRMTFGQSRGLKRSIYAVTETRALIITDLPRLGLSFKEYVFQNMTSINLENVKGNVGTIRFEPAVVYGYEYRRYGRRAVSEYSSDRELMTAFIMIDDVHKVYHMISERLGK